MIYKLSYLDIHVWEREVVEDKESLVLKTLGGHGYLLMALRARQQCVDVRRIRNRLLQTNIIQNIWIL